MSLTSIASKFFLPRQHELERYFTQPEELQKEVLHYLVSKGCNTEYGRNHLFSSMDSYDDIAQNVPVKT